MTRIRLTQRRNMVREARGRAQEKVVSAIKPAFDKEFKRVERFLRRSNLRKRLLKIKVPDGVEEPALYKVQELFKIQPSPLVPPNPTDPAHQHNPLGIAQQPPTVDHVQLDDWKKVLIAALLISMAGAIGDLVDVENEVWTSRGFDPLEIDPDKIISDYQARTGRDFGDIANTTTAAIQRIIAGWYSDDEATFPDLLASLHRYYDDNRMDTIAHQETGDALSQVVIEEMNQYGLESWYWDAMGENPCSNPIVISGRTYEGCRDLNGRVFNIGDPMPPDAAHINCECLPTPKEA